MRGKLIDMSIVAFALAVGGGCASSQHVEQPAWQYPGFAAHSPAASLVLPGEVLLNLSANAEVDPINMREDLLESQLEFARNDERLGGIGESRFEGFQIVEIRSREFLHTINGRPSEYSTTYTRSLKVGRSR